MASSTTKQGSHINTRLTSKTLPIALRNLQPQDAAQFSYLLSVDPASKPVDVPTSETIIGKMRESASKPTLVQDGEVLSGPGRVNLGVVLIPSNGGEEEEETLIGLGGFGAIKDWVRDAKNIRAGDCGVVIAPEHRGKGYAQESMRLAMDWAFAPVDDGGLQLDLVTITTESNNEPMIKLADEKLGLKGKGIIRDGEEGNGSIEMYYEVKPEEWKEL